MRLTTAKRDAMWTSSCLKGCKTADVVDVVRAAAGRARGRFTSTGQQRCRPRLVPRPLRRFRGAGSDDSARRTTRTPPACPGATPAPTPLESRPEVVSASRPPSCSLPPARSP